LSPGAGRVSPRRRLLRIARQEGLEDLGFLWAAVLCLRLTLTSAVVPWVNAELPIHNPRYLP
jgi:hypothetical protein